MAALPREWGAYRFRLIPAGGIDYVGITSNLYQRIAQHRSDGRYYDPDIHAIEYQIAKTGVFWAELCSWEKEKIARHAPGLVTYVGGNGRRPTIEINGEVVEISEDESVEDALTELGFFDRLGGLLSKFF